MSGRRFHRSRGRRALGTVAIFWTILWASLWLPEPGAARGVELDLDPEGWIFLEGPNYGLHSDADPEIAAQVLVDLERFRSLFAQLAPGLDLRPPAPMRMVAFDGPRSFGPYKTRSDGAGSLILGQFHRHPDANHLLLDARTRAGPGYSVAFHELTHFFITHNVPRAPLWLNEGLAEYYGTFAVQGSRAVVGRPIEHHVRYLLGLEEIEGLEDLLAVGHADADHAPMQVGRFYALSWLLVHYLLSQPDGTDRTADYLLRLRDGDDPDEAFEDAFDTRLRDVERELWTYLVHGDFPQASLPVKTLDPGRLAMREAPAAEVLTVLGDFVLNVGAVGYAEAHYLRALDFDPSFAVAHAGLAMVHHFGGSWQEAELLFGDAHRLGISDPLSFVRYARHSLAYSVTGLDQLLEGGAPKSATEAELLVSGEARAAASRARTVLEAALRAEPHYAVAHSLLAAAHLAPGGEAREGLEAALAAQRIQPDSLLPRVLEIRLRLRLAEDEEKGVGQIERARSRIYGLPAYGATASLVADLEQRVEVARWLRASALALAEGDAERAIQSLDEAVSASGDPQQHEMLDLRLRALQAELAPE